MPALLLGQGSLDMTSANPPVQSASPYKGLLARHPLTFFFIIAYAGTWLVELPYVLSADGSGLLPYSSPLLTWVLMPASIFLGPTLLECTHHFQPRCVCPRNHLLGHHVHVG